MSNPTRRSARSSKGANTNPDSMSTPAMDLQPNESVPDTTAATSAGSAETKKQRKQSTPKSSGNITSEPSGEEHSATPAKPRKRGPRKKSEAPAAGSEGETAAPRKRGPRKKKNAEPVTTVEPVLFEVTEPASSDNETQNLSGIAENPQTGSIIEEESEGIVKSTSLRSIESSLPPAKITEPIKLIELPEEANPDLKPTESEQPQASETSADSSGAEAADSHSQHRSNNNRRGRNKPRNGQNQSKASEYRPIPENPPTRTELLISQSINLLSQISEILQSPEATAEVIDSMIQTDEHTGETFLDLHIPVNNRENVIDAVNVIATLLNIR